MKPTGPTNPYVRELIVKMRRLGKQEDSKFWKDLAYRLEKPRRIKKGVNVSKIEKYIQEGEIAVVPYKLLGGGEIKKKVVVAALSYSVKAKEKIENAGGKVISIEELMESNPKGKKVRIFE